MTTISFEFFPPRSLDASFRLWQTVNDLAPLNPSYVSVTYGAGGTTRDLTHDAVKTINKHYNMPVAAHLTCVDASREETMQIVDSYAEAGISEIVALRGDPPDAERGFEKHPDGFADSCELIEALADTGKFTIRVGAYPDPHPEAAHDMADVEWLKRKIDAGASSALTQFFFESETFFRFRDKCEKAGIDPEIIHPGVLPIDNWAGTARFAAKTGTIVPSWVPEAFEKAKQSGNQELLSTAMCTELCTELMDGGVNHLHFYTLNKPHLTRTVARALGLEPAAALRKVA